MKKVQLPLFYLTKVCFGLVPPSNMRRAFINLVMPLQCILAIKQPSTLVALELDFVFSVCGTAVPSDITLFCKRLVANITPTRLVWLFFACAGGFATLLLVLARTTARHARIAAFTAPNQTQHNA